MKMMASKKKHQPSLSDENTKHLSGALHPLMMVPPPVPPRPLLAALKLSRKLPLKDHASKRIPSNQKFLRIGPPNGGFYTSNSCDNVHQLTRQPFLNQVSVYGSSHIILGQHIHAGGGPKTGYSRKNGGALHLKSSSSVKLPSKPNFVGSHPDMNSYQYLARSPWGQENYDNYVDYNYTADRRGYGHRKALVKEPCTERKMVKENHAVGRKACMKENYVDRKCFMTGNQVDRKLVEERTDGLNFVHVNGYDNYDPRYYNDSYHHKNTLPVPCYPSRKIYSTYSSSSSKSSSKSKSSSNYSNHEHNSSSLATYTFNQCTFRADSSSFFRRDSLSSKSNKQMICVSSERNLTSVLSACSSSASSSKPSSNSVASYSDYSPISDFSKLFPLSAKMTSLHGLPPLPKSLSSVNLQSSSSVVPASADMSNGNTLMDQRNGGGGGTSISSESESKGFRNEERKGRCLPTPPASLSQSNVAPLSYAPSANRKPVSLDAKLTLLRQEMFGLRQLDLSLLSQLWSLNESIQEFRQLQESISVPSPSDDGEDIDEMIYSNLAHVSNRRYGKLNKNCDGSSSSSSSVDFGKV